MGAGRSGGLSSLEPLSVLSGSGGGSVDNHRTLLRYRSDASAAAVIVSTASGMILGAAGVVPLWTLPIVLVALRWVGLVQHNHTHVPVFRARALNTVFDVLLTLASGVPQRLYRYIHIAVHHKFLNRPEDWTGPFSYVDSSFPQRPTPMWRYSVTFMVRGWRRGFPAVWRRPGGRVSLLVCTLPIAMFAGVAAFVSPARTALFLLVPWVATGLALPVANWRQHQGCSYESPSTSANVNLTALCRTLGFNVGYHSAHHARPGVHWSRLPTVRLDTVG